MDITIPGAGHRSLPEAVYEWLRSAIFEGRFQPGQMLRQDELARQLGVSRVPLREALQRLEGQGQVVLYPRRGYAVTSLDPDEIMEIFELRTLVEERAARYSTSCRTDADVARARRLVEEMEATPPSGPDGIARWSELNIRFHETLLSCGRLRYVQRLADSLRSVVEPYIRMETSMTGDLGQAQREHRQLLEAFARGDSGEVARLSRVHCEHTAERLLACLGRANHPVPEEPEAAE